MNLSHVHHDCPGCGEEILVDYESGATKVVCPRCKALCTVESDAEFIDGAWKDRTKLIPPADFQSNPKRKEPHAKEKPGDRGARE